MRTCRTCGLEKPDEEFYESSNGLLQKDCKDCCKTTAKRWEEMNAEERKAYGKRYYEDNKERILRNQRLKKYGITEEEYLGILERQNGGCAICGSSEPGKRFRVFLVDHCHKTGKKRGLLCVRCNTGLGMFEDDPERIRKAAEYLLGQA